MDIETLRKNYPLYNNWLKEEFLFQFEGRPCQETYWKDLYLFRRYEDEENPGDISFFSEDLLEHVLLETISSPSTLKRVSSVLKQYFEFCYNIQFCDTFINVNSFVKKRGIRNKLNKALFEYGLITLKQMYSICDYFCNKRDAAYHLLLYEGFTEREILELKEMDFSYEKLYLKDRIILNITADYIMGALNENYYICDNGHGKPVPFIPSKKLIKKTSQGAAKDGKANGASFAGIFATMKKEVGKSKLTPKRIRESGLIQRLIIEQNSHGGSLSDEQIIEFVQLYEFDLPPDKYILKHKLNEYRKNVDEFKRYFNIIESTDELDNLSRSKSKKHTSYGRRNSAWVSKLARIGELGERKIIYEFQKKYPNALVEQVSDKAGFDIYFTMSNKYYYLEVKTSYDLEKGFHITKKELITAERLSHRYILIIVILNSDYKCNEDEADIYVINDPINRLKIDVKNSLHEINLGICKLIDCSFEVKLSKDYVKSLNNLDTFYNSITEDN